MIVPSQANLETYWKDGEHKKVARWIPYFRCENTFIKNLNESNILQLKEQVNSPVLSLGADPEFILCSKNKPDEIVMFSSAYTGNKFGISEAVIGADYGLLEFRVPVTDTIDDFITLIEQLHKDFAEKFPQLDLLESEALEYNHELARLRDTMKFVEKQEYPAYGGHGYKETSVWNTGSTNQDIVLDETSNITLSAYDRPAFKKYRPDILSAGGHIHIGGTFIKSLSLKQLNKLVQRFDEKVLPICKTVETEAAILRETVYGTPGEYRLKEYGIEYRSPSNAIFHQKNLDTLRKILEIILTETKEFMFL